MGKSPFMGICAYVLLKNGMDKLTHSLILMIQMFLCRIIF